MIPTSRRQHRVLAAMHSSLLKSDPRLVATFAMFTRLTRDEAIPPVERVRLTPRCWAAAAGRDAARRWRRLRNRGPARGRRRGLMFIPVAAAAMLAVGFLLVSSQSSAAGCAPAHVLSQGSSQHQATVGRGFGMAPACPAGQIPVFARGR